jgi:hypothetical protein
MIHDGSARAEANSPNVRFVTADQVIRYTDLLVENMMTITEGDTVRALVRAVQYTEMAVVAGARPHEQLHGEVPFLVAVLVLVRDRLTREVSDQVERCALLAGG